MEPSRKTLMMVLSRTQRAWVQHMRKCALEVGIPESYRMIIMYLSRHPGANQKMMAEFSGKTTAAINQTVKEMVADGFARKETDASDGRCSKLFLTEAGNEKAEQLLRRLHQSDEKITEAIGEDKEQELIALLASLHTVIREDL